jgi:LmbE family N-acetylglucosaminyl deacetylase
MERTARTLIPLLWVAALTATAQVQSPVINQNAAAAYEALLRLRTTATVLHTTAHPDDEDGALLTWLVRSQGVRTGLFTLTRGEGGADLSGPELFDALGLIRTEELLAADRYYGVEQFFTRAADFGFSKRLYETLDRWGKENVLRDCVRVVRTYRPDVIVSRFHGAPRDGHGNHQAAGLLSAEVFKAAADPNMFPEQFLEGLRPWQVKKLYRSVRANEPATLKIDTGGYDLLLGASYRQIANIGLSLQRSQGAGTRRADLGVAISALALIENTLPSSAQGEKSQPEGGLLEGIDTTLRSLAKLAPALNLDVPLGEVEKDVASAIEKFDPRDPSRVLEQHVAPALRSLRAIIQNVSDAEIEEAAKFELLFRLRNKNDEFVRAGNLLAGIAFEVLVNPTREADGRATFAVAIPGQKFGITTTLVNRSQLRLEEVELGLSVRGKFQVSSTPSRTEFLGYNEAVKQVSEVTVQDDVEPTRPYWSRKDEYRDALHSVEAPQYAGLPYAPPEIASTASYRISGVRFTVSAPAQTVSNDSAAGEQRYVLAVAPAMSVQVTPRIDVIPVSRRGSSTGIHVQVMSNAKSESDAKVRLELPQGWSAAPEEIALHFTHEGEIQSAEFRVTAPRVASGRKYVVQAVAEAAGKKYREGYQIVARRGLETRFLYRPASAMLTGVDLRVPANLKLGYIMGAGDAVPDALEQMGVKPQMLSAADLANGNLAQFDTIVVGIRASAVRADYKTYNSRLMDYVKNGGNLVVQQQTSEFDAIPYGPFPFQLGRRPEEVVEEDAKVTILDPSNPLFTTPNAIVAADFDGWVQERGSSFLTTWDPQYKALLESHDRDQEPQRGGLVQAKFGKGTFTYVAYALYRQLPAGVPGAYRLLANLISLGKK